MKNPTQKETSPWVDTDAGLVSAKIFVDEEIYRLEQERIYSRSWLFLAHDSEIPEPGDFVTRWMGEDPVIVWRGQDRKARVFLNVCRHRGRRVCAEDVGKAAQMRCPYHGWTYSNMGKLAAVPFFEGYQGRLEKESLGLCEAKVESYRGLIFGSWDEKAEGLEEYLGEMRWVLDLMFGRSDGAEVVGGPMRWTTDANWKLAAANFAGDGTHIFTTHGFRTALGIETIGGKRDSYTFPTPGGHAAAITSWPYETKYQSYLGLPQSLWPELERQLSPEQFKLMESLQVIVGNFFPNLSFLNTSSHLPEELAGSDEATASFLTLRQWQPKGPQKMEVWSWCFVDKNAPAWWKEASRQCYLRSFGMAGMFEQDDMENWGEITQALRGSMARRLDLQYKMGLEATPAPAWPGPGTAYLQRPTFLEVNERHFYRRWQELIQSEA
ncbi:MAG TPA: Rieske 2Fe-2S domain-containing protein [Candidatus Binatia bacterium]|jgi:phenylpropionate dioxygenase-like ring-hydroxylating dioxygenase large terminal subunit